MYEEALRELEEQFGDPAAVVQHTLASVLQLSPVKQDDLAGLTQLSRALHAAVCTLKSHRFYADLAATTNMRQVVAKLPRNLAWRWGEAELELSRRQPTLADLDEWLRKVVIAGRRGLPELSAARSNSSRDPGHQVIRPARPSRQFTTTGSRGSESQRTTLATQEAVTSAPPCVICSGEAHQPQECQQFQDMFAIERLQLIRDSKRCFRCLGEGHWARQCPDRSLCGYDSCRGRHHRLLHTSVSARREAVEASGAEDPHSVMVTNKTPERGHKSTLLQVAPVRIYGSEGAYIDTCALLDSGADTSLCAERVLRQLSVTAPARQKNSA